MLQHESAVRSLLTRVEHSLPLYLRDRIGLRYDSQFVDLGGRKPLGVL